MTKILSGYTRYEFFQRGYFEKVTGKIKYIPAAGGGVF